MASQKLMNYVEKHLFKSVVNPMWQAFSSKNSVRISDQTVDEFITLQKATLEYKKLLEDYNIGIKRDDKKTRISIAKHCGLIMPNAEDEKP
ncbi:unnamed protein product [Blepharisma stoltei]|uniref:Uncharacterized protein n=1 Tax=Blepharisma stoltei TaxID=1481888 RepID=A0AAU9IQZ2_9CILI|nr:unnamed protein product [Blepharisma stoltei]